MTTLSINAKAVTLNLDSLAQMSLAELQEVYTAGSLPKSLAQLDGEPQGRMLALRYLERTPISFVLRQFAAMRLFPWAGKTFSSHSAWLGEGINRIRLGTSRNWFRFQTRKDVSALDGQPCILLDYDLPENPWAIRQIRDELREVSPGLFLGPAMWRQQAGAALVLFFAIDTRADA